MDKMIRLHGLRIQPSHKEAAIRCRAEIADPTIAELEAAGTNYPAWVQDRYLEVPQNIQAVIQTLAEQVTKGQSTPYDQAEAITNYLRNTIQYSTNGSFSATGRRPGSMGVVRLQKRILQLLCQRGNIDAALDWNSGAPGSRLCRRRKQQ